MERRDTVSSHKVICEEYKELKAAHKHFFPNVFHFGGNEQQNNLNFSSPRFQPLEQQATSNESLEHFGLFFKYY